MAGAIIPLTLPGFHNEGTYGHNIYQRGVGNNTRIARITRTDRWRLDERKRPRCPTTGGLKRALAGVGLPKG